MKEVLAFACLSSAPGRREASSSPDEVVAEEEGETVVEGVGEGREVGEGEGKFEEEEEGGCLFSEKETDR